MIGVGRPPTSATRCCHASCVLHRRRPRDVVDGAGARDAAARPAARRRRSSRRAGRRASPTASRPCASKPSFSRNSALRVSGSGEYARTPSKPCSASSRGISGCSATSGSSGTRRDHELVVQPFRIDEADDVAVARRRRRARPRSRAPPTEPTRQTTVCTMPLPARPFAAPGILEERDVGARVALLVGVEEVVDGRVVLVDGLLHEPQPQHAGVVLDVLRRVARDAGDVMDSLQLHLRSPQVNGTSDRLSRSISRAITSRWISCVPS